MKAFTKKRYGGPEVLSLEEIKPPSIGPRELLVRVKANSLNPADWHILRGKPYFARLSFGLFKPKNLVLGSDFAGQVEAVGKDITQFKVGDKVFGENLEGAFAESTACAAANIALMPESCSYEEMAAIPIAGLTALQALRDHGHLQRGESVLINGASGGVGHYAVQIAKAMGAKVTGVCSSRNKDFVKSLGADLVLAYDEEGFKSFNEQHDLVIDCHGNLLHADFKRFGQRAVLVGFTTMKHMFTLLLTNVFSKYSIGQFTAKVVAKDLATLAEMIESKQIKSHIEQIYPAMEIPQAIAHIEKMRTRGKVVASWTYLQPLT